MMETWLTPEAIAKAKEVRDAVNVGVGAMRSVLEQIEAAIDEARVMAKEIELASAMLDKAIERVEHTKE